MSDVMRWLRNIGAAVSLALCLVSAALWVRSQFVERGEELFKSWYDAGAATYGHNIVGVAPGVFYVATARMHYADATGKARMERNLAKGIYAPGYTYRKSREGLHPNTFRPPLTKLEQQGFMFRRSPFPPPGTRASSSAPTGSLTNLWLPLWLPTALLAIAPALSVAFALRRRHLSRRGLCAKCGYDLRESPLRCPECGTPAPAWRKRAYEQEGAASEDAARMND
jgi:hypothetical protein